MSASTAVITGAGRGIGRAIALAFAREGMALELVARTRAQLLKVRGLCEQAGAPEVEIHCVDLIDHDAVSDFCDELLSRKGAVDVLVNNAGILVSGHALDGDIATWTQAMHVNVLTPMLLTSRLAPGMVERERGLILNVGSVAGLEGMTDAGAYATTKHALRGWSRSCYQKLRASGVKVVLLNPGFVDTDMTAHFGGDRQRALRTEDIAEAAMLAVRTSAACCPEEITLRLTKPAFG